MGIAADSAISVIVPTYNSARYLGETLDAVLAQTRPADDIVVVDDGSTDDSADIAEAFAPDVRVLRVDHAGTAASRHRGYEATTGDLVANCDADDVWMPTKLERQLALLSERPELDAVGCLVDEFLSPDADPSSIPGRGLRLGQTAHAASALVVRRRMLDRIDGYRSDHQLGEALDWNARAASAGMRTGMVDEVLVRRRIHDRNNSRSFATESDEYLNIMRTHLQRQRSLDP